MEIELLGCPRGQKNRIWKDFLAQIELEADPSVERTVLIWEDGELIATGSRQANVLKCIAVHPQRQGEGLTATVLSQLRQDAFQAGHSHLFLYTKPRNEAMFSSLFFYSVACTEQVLLMENKKDGIGEFLRGLPEPAPGSDNGAVVMNCDPFTLGHRYLVETAAKNCRHLYVFVLSEDRGHFSAADRMEMVRRGTADIENVTVLPTGPYLISAATFPTYFLKDRDLAEQVHCMLDIQIFTRYFAPRMGICKRFVGTEPISAMTRQYNEALLRHLPEQGIGVFQITRLERQGEPVSASRFRALAAAGQKEEAKLLVPETTHTYLQEKALL